MSSNDYISIIRNKKGSFEVKYCDADVPKPRFKIGEKKSLADAIKLANDWQDGDGHRVEYGLYIPNPKGT